MKKLFLFITFIFACFGFSFKSSASYLPPTLPQTQVVPDFLQSVAQYEIVNDSNTYIPKTDLNAVNQIVNGRSIENSLQYTYLDNSTLNAEFGTIYNISGVEVNQNDTYTVYGTSDLGPFMCICEKNTGEILYQGEPNSLHSTLVGGQGLKESFPAFIVRDLTGAGGVLDAYDNIKDAVDDARLDSMIIYGNSLTSFDKDFLSSYPYYLYMETNNGWSCYVPNACDDNTLVANYQSESREEYHGYIEQYSNASYHYRPIVYTNDPSQVFYIGSGFAVGLNQTNSEKYGYTFNYESASGNWYLVLGNGGYLDCVLPSRSEYIQYREIAEDSVYLQPVDDIINENDSDIYNYTSIIQNPPSYTQYVNNNYNYEGDKNFNNYPTYFNYSFPTYPNNSEYVTNIYNYYTTPNTGGGSAGSITDPILPENIPILSNLEYRFPFSIPFDLYKLAKGLSVPRETPYIDTVIIIPGINYSWHINYDLHAFDNVAELFRLLELILFIVALAVFSYDHFFGS